MKLSSLIGLTKEKERARITIAACRYSHQVFPHILLWGIGGTGKTAFARAIGVELDFHCVEDLASSFKKQDTLFSCLMEHSSEATSMGRTLYWFVDEIHRLGNLQEALYHPMMEFRVPKLGGYTNIPPFTFVGATTRFDMLDSNSFITRFGNVWEIKRYEVQDIAQIIAAEFVKSGFKFNPNNVLSIAQRCLGIPRIAVKLAQKVMNVAYAERVSEITVDHIRHTFELEEVDYLGLVPVHRQYLRMLHNRRSNGEFVALGVGTLAAKMRQPEDLVSGSVEPILLEMEFIASTPRGRMLTDKGAEYLKKVKEIP